LHHTINRTWAISAWPKVIGADSPSLRGKRPPTEAARRLIGLMYSEDERVALMAADKVLDRAWGRPKEPDQPTSHEQRFAAMTPDERAADAVELVERIRATLAASRAIEHEPEE
jgi:hypothetical protein